MNPRRDVCTSPRRRFAPPQVMQQIQDVSYPAVVVRMCVRDDHVGDDERPRARLRVAPPPPPTELAQSASQHLDVRRRPVAGVDEDVRRVRAEEIGVRAWW